MGRGRLAPLLFGSKKQSWSGAAGSGSIVVSAARAALINDFVAAEQVAGTWDLTDDYWIFAGENQPQALLSLKGGRTGALVGAPTFAASQGYSFVASSAIDTKFVPYLSARAMSQASSRIAVWETANVASAGLAMGISNTGAGALGMTPRSATDQATFTVMGSPGTGWTPVTDSRGFHAASNNSVNVASYFNGVNKSSDALVTPSIGLPLYPLYVGARNINGAVGNSRTGSTIAAAAIGGALTPAQELSQFNNFAAFMSALGLYVDPDATLWANQVVTNGGTVSAAQLQVISTFIAREKRDGCWYLTDDYWYHWAENSIQSRTSLKQRRLATAVNSPVFTANFGWTFDGVTSYIGTGFIPLNHAVAMTVSNCRIGGYEMTAVDSTGFTAGVNSGSTRTFRYRAYSNPSMSGELNTNGFSSSYPSSSIGFGVLSRSADAGTAAMKFKNGVNTQFGSVPSIFAASMALVEIFLGGFNSGAGALSAARPCTVGFLVVGASLTPSQDILQYKNLMAAAASTGVAV